jgi:hypothetical protein
MSLVGGGRRGGNAEAETAMWTPNLQDQPATVRPLWRLANCPTPPLLGSLAHTAYKNKPPFYASCEILSRLYGVRQTGRQSGDWTLAA